MRLQSYSVEWNALQLSVVSTQDTEQLNGTFCLDDPSTGRSTVLKLSIIIVLTYLPLYILQYLLDDMEWISGEHIYLQLSYLPKYGTLCQFLVTIFGKICMKNTVYTHTHTLINQPINKWKEKLLRKVKKKKKTKTKPKASKPTSKQANKKLQRNCLSQVRHAGKGTPLLLL